VIFVSDGVQVDINSILNNNLGYYNIFIELGNLLGARGFKFKNI